MKHALLVAFIAALLPLSVFAASPSASVTVNQPVLHHRDTATFSYVLPKQSKGECAVIGKTYCAVANLMCYQGSTLVYSALQPAQTAFYLESGIYAGGTPFWPEGGASCIAYLGDYKNPYPAPVGWIVWAQTSFTVLP